LFTIIEDEPFEIWSFFQFALIFKYVCINFTYNEEIK
jgi:hypothetical protein